MCEGPWPLVGCSPQLLPTPLPTGHLAAGCGHRAAPQQMGKCHAHTTSALRSLWLLPKLSGVQQALPVGSQGDNRRGRVGDESRKSSSVRHKTPCFSAKPHLPSPIHASLPYLPVRQWETKPSRPICPSFQAAAPLLQGNINTENKLIGLCYLICYRHCRSNVHAAKLW